MSNDVEEPREGLSRRQVLKRAAVIGAVAWGTPVVQSINPARAFATGGDGGDEPDDSGGGSPHQVCYTVKIGRSGNCYDDVSSSYYQCVEPTGETGGCDFVEASPAWPSDSSGTMTVGIASNCELVDAASWCDPGCAAPTPTPNPNVWTFGPCGGGSYQGGISHIELTICCTDEGDGGDDHDHEHDGDHEQDGDHEHEEDDAHWWRRDESTESAANDAPARPGQRGSGS